MALADNWTNFIRIHGGESGARDMFEKAMGELLKAENPDKEVHVIKAAPGDGGIDVYVQQDDGIDIYQCKYFMDKMTSSRWQQVKDSFDRAMEPKGIEVLRWFLCIPMEFRCQDIAEINKFKKDRYFHGVEIAFIDGDEIINRMEKIDPQLRDKYFSPTRTKNEYLYNKLQDRFLNQSRGHPSIKMMIPDPMLFPKGLPAIKNTEREAIMGNLRLSSIKEMILKSWEGPERKHILFVGEGGIGKTVAMLMLPKEDWFLRYKIPVIYVALQNLYVYGGKLNEYINDNYKNELDGIKELSTKSWTSHPNLIVLLDGFNEIPMGNKQTAEKHIRFWMEKPGVQIITTSRISFSIDISFLEYELQPLQDETIKKYLISVGIKEANLPSQEDHIWKVINVPLLLTMFVQIDKVKSRTNNSFPISQYLEWMDSENATHIIWNYLLVELYRLISMNEKAGVSIATAILSIAPFVCFEMVRNNQFFIVQNDFIGLLRKAVQFFSQNQKIQHNQINKIRNDLYPFWKENLFDERKIEDYFYILSEQSALFPNSLETVSVKRTVSEF